MSKVWDLDVFVFVQKLKTKRAEHRYNGYTSALHFSTPSGPLWRHWYWSSSDPGWVVFFRRDGRRLINPCLSSWWLNQPLWKICSSKWVHLPQFSGWKFQKCLSRHHLALCLGRKTIKTHTESMGLIYLPMHEWWIFMANAGKYTIHGWYGRWLASSFLGYKFKLHIANVLHVQFC